MNEKKARNDHQPVARNEIVVGIDESPASAAALRWAAEQSRTTGFPLRLVHTWQISAAESGGVVAYPLETSAEARARISPWIVDTFGEEFADTRWTLDVHEGFAGAVLVGVSRGAQLLVVGAREHTGLRRVISGSVGHYVLSHAEVPVVAVPADPAEPAVASEVRRTPTVVGPLY